MKEMALETMPLNTDEGQVLLGHCWDPLWGHPSQLPWKVTSIASSRPKRI